MKVVLVNPPQFGRYAQPPMGLASLAAVLESQRIDVAILDANALGLRPEEVVSHVADADVVGLTAMTPTIGAAVEIARVVKESKPGMPVLLGGAHATLLPEETLATATGVDVVIRGEGEKVIVDLLRALASSQSLDELPGITYREGGEVISTLPATENVDLDSLPFLAYHLLPWRRYKPHPPHGRASPFAAIITSRGCPYHCSYCSKPVFGTKFRARSPLRVTDEIAYYRERFHIGELAFYDDVFTLDGKRAHGIAEGMLQKGLKIPWTCETRVNLVDRELLQHMKQAGCYAIAYGLESASPEILQTLSKNISLEQVEAAVRLTREAGIQTIGYFMLGSPGETPETVRRTIDFAKKLKLNFAQFAVTIPFPGTELYDIYLRNGHKDISWEDLSYARLEGGVTPVFESDRLSKADLQHWMKRAYREFYLRPGYIGQRIGHVRSLKDIIVNIKGFSMLLGNVK